MPIYGEKEYMKPKTRCQEEADIGLQVCGRLVGVFVCGLLRITVVAVKSLFFNYAITLCQIYRLSLPYFAIIIIIIVPITFKGRQKNLFMYTQTNSILDKARGAKPTLT